MREQQPLQQGRSQEALSIYSSLEIYGMRSIDGLSTILCNFSSWLRRWVRRGLKSGKDACQVMFKLFQGFCPLGTFTLLASLSSLGTKGDQLRLSGVQLRCRVWRLARHNHNLDSELTEC